MNRIIKQNNCKRVNVIIISFNAKKAL